VRFVNDHPIPEVRIDEQVKSRSGFNDTMHRVCPKRQVGFDAFGSMRASRVYRGERFKLFRQVSNASWFFPTPSSRSGAQVFPDYRAMRQWKPD
jgi:hypothetical protein